LDVFFLVSHSGLGYSICIIDLYVGIHYNTVIGWAVYYLSESFHSELPWLSCNNSWNTPNCTLISDLSELSNYTDSEEMSITTPAKEYYEYVCTLCCQNQMALNTRLNSYLLIMAHCVFMTAIFKYFLNEF